MSLLDRKKKTLSLLTKSMFGVFLLAQLKNIFYLALVSGLINLFLLACAKKALPPSPDRFSPHLEKIEPINRTRIDLWFNEPIDISQLSTKNFVLVSVSQDTLEVKTITAGKKSEIISLFTPPAKPEIYTLSGLVYDRYGNLLRLRKRFRPSSIIDTLAPKIIAISPALGTLNKSKNIIIEVNFSEPIDTNRAINYLTLSLDKAKITPHWRSDWQGLYFSYKDSLPPKTYVYFLLLPTLTDLENNQLKELGYTFFTSDSVLVPLLVSGNLIYNTRPIKNGIVLFSRGNDKAITISRATGSFSLRLTPAIYNITAIADTNFDNRIDLSAKLIDSIFATKTININLHPVTEAKLVDEYLQADFK